MTWLFALPVTAAAQQCGEVQSECGPMILPLLTAHREVLALDVSLPDNWYQFDSINDST
jgi:hypothetical protein